MGINSEAPQSSTSSLKIPEILLHAPDGEVTTLKGGILSTPNTLLPKSEVLRRLQAPSKELLYPRRKYRVAREPSLDIKLFFSLILLFMAIFDWLAHIQTITKRSLRKRNRKGPRPRSKNRLGPQTWCWSYLLTSITAKFNNYSQSGGDFSWLPFFGGILRYRIKQGTRNTFRGSMTVWLASRKHRMRRKCVCVLNIVKFWREKRIERPDNWIHLLFYAFWILHR